MMRFVWLLLFAVMLSGAGVAKTPSSFLTTQSPHGAVIEFTSGDYILADGLTTPDTGWQRGANPNIYRLHRTGWTTGDFHALKGRFRFDRAAVGADPLAIYTVNMRNQFKISVNGQEIFRNYAAVDDRKMNWYRPFLIPVPQGVLRPGNNTIIFEVNSQEALGIGRVRIGPHRTIEATYRQQFFWQITVPGMANFAMLVLGLLAGLFWLGRRGEVELLWLAASTLLWFFRNSQYYFERPLFDMALYNATSVYATYFASVVTAAFYFYFAKLRHRGRIVAALMGIGVLLSAAHALLSPSNLIFYIPTTILIIAVAVLGFIDVQRHRNVEHGVLALALMVMPAASLYDVWVAGGSRGWDGHGIYLSMFGGLVYSVAFLISFGKRALDAFHALGTANILLEQRVAETRAELALSEAARQELVVAGALAHERERLMQEMHDGIGSNLITALAVARQQKQPAATIKTLSRAVADLKITVDSLEPVEGDLVALIGNLRHRMAGDLRDAGITCKWEVEPCRPLGWLDAANALHVLRIFQEAIGNVLMHSGASEMRIGCGERERDGIAGLVAFVADNGRGMEASLGGTQGKGLSNIRSRALSLHGALDCSSAAGQGMVVTLWLPYERKINPAAAG